MNKPMLLRLSALCTLAFLSSCAPSVTNVWDYYIKNNIEQHEPGVTSSSKAKVLYRKGESTNKAQLELIAYKDSKTKCLVIGSHKIAKAFYVGDSLYHFDVNDLYSHVRGNDFIRQMGDLSIFFTSVPLDKCEGFLTAVEKLKQEYMKTAVPEGTTSYTDLALTADVFISLQKKSTTQLLENADAYLWVGKRRHSIRFEEFMKAMQDFKTFAERVGV